MNDCLMSCGSRNVWRPSALPGASRKIATRAPTTTSVLAVEMAVARRPPPASSRGPRLVVPNEPGVGAPLSPASGPPAPGRPPCWPPKSLSSTPARAGALGQPGSGLEGRNAQVHLQVLLLQRLQGAVAVQRGQRPVDAADERVALAEQQAVVLAGAGELADQHRALDLGGGDE